MHESWDYYKCVQWSHTYHDPFDEKFIIRQETTEFTK